MTATPDPRDRFRGCLLGLAVGDALGAAVEFQPRGTFEPLTDMIGGGPHRLQPGQWTDDTSLALCLATSLVECQGFDARDQMDRYSRWQQEGYLSSTGNCFDIGNTVSASLARYLASGDPYAGSADSDSAGNGCIMRLAPIPMFCFPDAARTQAFAVDSARTTHGAPECLDASRLLAAIISRALAGRDKDDVLLQDRDTFKGEAKLVAIAEGRYRDKSEEQIRGSGYVVESLEAALWCFWKTESFAGAALTAANLGDDADTTAAVCGQVAGAFYGMSGIPARWLELLRMRDEVVQLADRLNEFSSLG